MYANFIKKNKLVVLHSYNDLGEEIDVNFCTFMNPNYYIAFNSWDSDCVLVMNFLIDSKLAVIKEIKNFTISLDDDQKIYILELTPLALLQVL